MRLPQKLVGVVVITASVVMSPVGTSGGADDGGARWCEPAVRLQAGPIGRMLGYGGPGGPTVRLSLAAGRDNRDVFRGRWSDQLSWRPDLRSHNRLTVRLVLFAEGSSTRAVIDARTRVRPTRVERFGENPWASDPGRLITCRQLRLVLDGERLRPERPADWSASIPGGAQNDCVDTSGHREAHSGDFVAGNFEAFVQSWNPAKQASSTGTRATTPLSLGLV